MIASGRFYGAFFIHDAGVVERIAFFGKGDDFGLTFRNDAAHGNIVRRVAEFLDDAADDAVIRMACKDGELAFAAVRTADIVRIHAGNEVIFALLDAKVQGFAEAAVFQETADAETRAELVLHVCNDRIQFRRQGAVTDKDEIIRRDSLVVDALHALTQVCGMFFVVNRHEYGIIFKHMRKPSFVGIKRVCSL